MSSLNHHIHYHTPIISRRERFELLGAPGATVWLTGLSGSGKSTIAAALEHRFLQLGRRAYRLDGDNLRSGINKDLGFLPGDRAENIRRIAEVARLFADSGAVAIVSAISPYRADRDAARALHQDPHHPLCFLEVFVDTPLETCERRDPKGLYRKARAGEIADFTGIGSPYEPPQDAELVLKTDQLSVHRCVEICVERCMSELDAWRDPGNRG